MRDEYVLVYEYLQGTGTGKVLIDVGAHRGGVSAFFLQNGWSAHAFEPDDLNRGELLRLRDRYPGLRVDSRAVGERAQQGVPFFRSSISDGISGLHRFHASHEPAGLVDTVTLDDYCQAQAIKEVDFLKIDAEAHDLFVLRGFPWARVRPAIVMCEFEDRKTRSLGYTVTDLAKILAGQGYSILVSEWYPIVEYGQTHRWRRFAPYPCELLDPDAWGNIIAFAEPIDWGRLLTALAQCGAPLMQAAEIRLEVLGRELAEVRAHVQAMQQSRSWRLTAPLRFVRKLLLP
jgi:FkbM family methyltransferase